MTEQEKETVRRALVPVRGWNGCGNMRDDHDCPDCQADLARSRRDRDDQELAMAALRKMAGIS